VADVSEGRVTMSVVQPIRPSVQVNAGNSFLDNHGKPRRDFPVWHFAMVNDQPRNEAIEHAIAALGLAGKTVVEIGTGTGLIALLFAKYGAARVVSCEMNANLAGVAQRIVAATPYADRITIINESSTVAIQRGLMPRQPDVIFTETLDCGVVGEGFMPIAEDIRRLAGPDTIIMPRVVRQFAALIDSDSLANLNRAGFACGFDLSLLNDYATGNYFPVHTELHPHRFLSESAKLRDYTYIGCPDARPMPVRATSSGTAHGLLSWFNAEFGCASVANEPFSGGHWHQAFHPLAEEMTITEGEEISLLIDDGGFAFATRGA
jgi:type I protein arginine methyltransferase